MSNDAKRTCIIKIKIIGLRDLIRPFLENSEGKWQNMSSEEREDQRDRHRLLFLEVWRFKKKRQPCGLKEKQN